MSRPPAPGRTLALAPWALSVLGLVALVAYGIVQYPSMPAELPTHYGPSGEADAWRAKSTAVVFGPLMIGAAIIAGVGVITAAMPAIMRAPEGASEWAHWRTAVMRRATTGMLGLVMVALMGLFAYISLVTWSGSSHMQVWAIVGFLVVVLAAFLPLRRVNDWAERSAEGAGVRRTADDIADDARWTPSGLYRGEPGEPLFVPKRPGYGVGATINVNHPGAKFLFLAFALVVALPLGLMFIV